MKYNFKDTLIDFCILMAGTLADLFFFYLQDVDSIRIAVKLFTGFTGGIIAVTIVYLISNSKSKNEEVEDIYLKIAEAKVKDFVEAQVQEHGPENTRVTLRLITILLSIFVLAVLGCFCGAYGTLSIMTNNLFGFVAIFVLCVRIAYKTFEASNQQPPNQ